MMLAVGLSYMTFNILRFIPSRLNLLEEIFIMEDVMFSEMHF